MRGPDLRTLRPASYTEPTSFRSLQTDATMWTVGGRYTGRGEILYAVWGRMEHMNVMS